MKKIRTSLILGLILAAGVAIAQDKPTDPTVIAWNALMREQGGAAKTLGDMASGKAPFDAAAAETAKAKLIETSMAIPAAFQTQASDPASKAKPEIWTNWDDFVAKAEGLASAAQAMDTSAVGSIGAGMGAIGGACQACHQAYRM